jgi:membrane dipeptidase
MCCTHFHAFDFSCHHSIWSTPKASVQSILSGEVGPDGSTEAAQVAEFGVKALEVLCKEISVDVHTHGGPQGIYSPAPPNGMLAAGMRTGSLAAVCLSEIPDEPLLGRNAAGITGITRLPKPGELYKHHLGRLAWIDEMVAHHGLRRALTAADLASAHIDGQPALIGGVEGLDFMEGKLERLEEAHQRGIRSAQLVHYTPSDIGDFQMGVVTHDGLTEYGTEMIRACHRLNMLVDVAHATEQTAMAVAKIATRPILLSHTALAGSRAMASTRLAARCVSPDHARAIADTGGVVGIWAIFPDLDKYVEGLKEMADVVGVDHVCVGTDQQVTPVALQDYAQWVNLIAAMLRGGFTPEEAGKIAGGNYMRVFRAAVG